MSKKVWLVVFPTYLYKEDVAKVAADNDLRVINSRFADQYTDEQIEGNPPALTLTTETPKKKVKRKASKKPKDKE